MTGMLRKEKERERDRRVLRGTSTLLPTPQNVELIFYFFCRYEAGAPLERFKCCFSRAPHSSSTYLLFLFCFSPGSIYESDYIWVGEDRGAGGGR